MAYFLLIKVEMPTIVGISIFNEQEKIMLIASGPDCIAF